MKKFKIGYTCGVFDLFHVGHLNLLQKCKEQCDYLIVGICNDEYVAKIKHKTPVFSEEERLRIVGALKAVDKAVLVDAATTNDKLIAHNMFQFNVLFSGDDWKGSERYLKTEEQFRELGVSIVYLPYTKGVSSSQLKLEINKTKKKVLTFGVFDYFHLGHLRLFERCRQYGDYLIVAVQKESEIAKTKPAAKIYYTTEQRMDMISSIRIVDQVLEYSQVDIDIRNIDFDVLVVGEDQTHAGFQRAIDYCDSMNKTVVRLPRTPNISSSFLKGQ